MKSIRTKLTLLTIWGIVIVVSIVTVIAVISVRGLGNRNAEQMLLLMCETGEKNLNSYFDSVEQVVTTVSTLIEEDLENTSPDQMSEHVEKTRSVFEKVIFQTTGVLTYYYRIDPDYSKDSKGFWYTNLYGDGYESQELTDITLYDTNDTSELPWFTVPKVTGEPVWLPPYITETIDIRVLSYNVPIYKDSEFVGVVGIELDYRLMTSEVGHITLYEDGYAFITDMEGNLIYHPQIDVALTDLSAIEVPTELQGDERYNRYTFNGEEKLGVWLPLENGMRINVCVPTSEVNKVWQKTVIIILVVSILLLIVVGMFMMRRTRRLTKPLVELTKATEQLDQGDYNIELHYDGEDEIGILTKSFSKLANNLQSEIYALAESEQANKAKTAFLSNMSHEIRTPITTILGMNEIIYRESTDDNILGYCENIRKAGNNLLGIISDILDFSKIEAGKMELVDAPFSLKDIIRDLYNMILVRAEGKGLSLQLDIDPELPEGLVGDELRIKQVITNLLTNAVKYTETGSVTMRVALEKKTKNKANVYVAIVDTGIGIREEEMDKLFESFDRLDLKKTNTIEGTGLGLPICRKLVEMMGSEISVDSTYGVGSTFSFYMEQEISDPTEIGEFNEAVAAESVHTHSEDFSFVSPLSRILIVDDTPMNLEVIKGLLKPTEIKIDLANSGEECIEKFAANPYDLVFLDYRMPQMDGIETLNALKEKEPEKAEATPIVSLTANAISGERERMLEAGFDDFLTKPVIIPDMEVILIKYLPEDKVFYLEDEEEEPEADPLEGIPKEAFDYPWLDPKEGVEYCGTAFVYLNAIRLFTNAIDEKSEVIEKCIAEYDIDLYTITVHSLKSASLSIGMADFSDRAKQLELAGHSGDKETIEKDTPDFLKFYREMKKDLEYILEKAEAMGQAG